MSNVLWLTSNSFSNNQKDLITGYINAVNLGSTQHFFINPHFKFQKLVIKRTDHGITFNGDVAKEVHAYIQNYIQTLQITQIVTIDDTMLGLLTGETYTIHKARGAVYQYEGLPLFVMGDPLSIVKQKDGAWIYVQDLQKLKRWIEGNKRPQPKFRYKVCETIEDLDNCVARALDAELLAQDIETSGYKITVFGIAMLEKDGGIFTYVIPFINPLKYKAIHWETHDLEVYALECVKQIQDSQVVKTYQNGSYDCAYQVRYRIPPSMYLLDTMHMFHSIWMEARKSLGFITSLMVDNYRYWKDESKDDKEEAERFSRIPGTIDGYCRYLRYNGLDCYYTLLDIIYELEYYRNIPWVRTNYNIEFRNQVGPYFMMSMHGMEVNKTRQAALAKGWQEEHNDNLTKMRLIADDPEFNPSSPQQVASLLYDVFGAAPMKFYGAKKTKNRSTDKTVLKFIRLQHPIIRRIIDTIIACKEPLNNLSKYENLGAFGGRFLYSINAAGTTTGRVNSKSHMFRVGTNANNVPKPVRVMMCADPGYFFFEPDFSQSDCYFIAYECEDENFIANITDDRDTHSVHAEFFFKRKYEEVYEAHKRKEHWVEDPIVGVRQNTKRIVHGADFLMEGETMYQHMGHEAAIGTAEALGYRDANTWGKDRLVGICQQLIDGFKFQLYPGLSRWHKAVIPETVANGNLAVLPFGRTRLFFGNLKTDKKLQRDLAAHFGQGGTGDNINRVCNDVYYKTDLVKQGLRFVTQTHDSILFAIPIEKAFMCEKILDIMEQPVIIKGRQFVVPAEGECGFTWSAKGGMVGWDDGEDVIRRMVDNENLLRKKFGEKLMEFE